MSVSIPIKLVPAPGVRQSWISDDGKYLAAVCGSAEKLAVFRDPAYPVPVELPAQPIQCTSAAFRKFLVSGNPRAYATEILYSVGRSCTIFRRAIQTGKLEPGLVTGLERVQELVSSPDGRYVAAGDLHGRVEVWNLDTSPERPFPVPVFEGRVSRTGAICSLTFNRTNTELYLSTTSGELYRVMVLAGRTVALHNQMGWPCYDIACSPAGNSLAFAGEAGLVWLVGSGLRDFPPEQCPFELDWTAGNWHVLSGLVSGYALGCLKTGVDGYAAQVRFIGEDRLAVMGMSKLEIWDLANTRLLAECRIDREDRLIGMGPAGPGLCALFQTCAGK